MLALLCGLCLSGAGAPATALAAPALRWSGALEVDHGGDLTAVSCPSLGLCVAVDSAGRAVLSSRPAADEAAAWSLPFALPGAGTLAGISCAGTSLCVAVNTAGHALASTRPTVAEASAWSSAFAIRGAGALSSVSCASVSLCVAVSSAGKVSFATDPAGGETAWSEAAPLPGMGPVSSVSCASATLCAAVDDEGHIAVTAEPAAGAGSWHARLIDPSEGLRSVSCSAGACVAVDAEGDALASPDPAANAGAGAGSGATWTSTLVDLAGEPSAVSCTQAGLCAALDSDGYALATDDPLAAPPSWSATLIDAGQVGRALSCTAAGICAAVDGAGRVLVGSLPAPAVTATGAGAVSHTVATAAGIVDPQDASVGFCSFEYGTSTAYGASVPCSGLGEGGGAQAVCAALTGLSAGTTYHYRIAVANPLGSASSADASFQTLAPYVVEPHPSISGIPAPGQQLSCHSGVSASGVTLSYAWLRDTAAIAGATASVYTVAGADASHHLQCRVTARTAEGSKSATSSFVTVPAGGVGTVIETSVGAPRASGDTVQVPLRCSPNAAPSGCTIYLRLSARISGRTVALGSATVHLALGARRTALVAASAKGRRLISRHHRLSARLLVSGTVVGVINATLETASLTLPGHGSAAAVRHSGFLTVARPRALAPGSRRGRARAAGGATPAAVLAPTPYMGWDTYFTFGGHFDEASVLAQASQLETRGLEADGYRYVWLDVDWWHGARAANGEIVVSSSQWPHGMAWLASTLHAAGFKVGLYTDAGREGCGGATQGSYGHYQQDVNTFAAWGFDAVKVDFCGGVRMGLSPAAAYGAFHQAIVANASHRPMLLAICNYLQPGQYTGETPAEEGSAFASYTFGPSSGTSWRTDTDVGTPGDVAFENVLRNLDADAAEPQAAGPGHWNDPDYLGPGQGMSTAQFRTQFGMWAMLDAPLMLSADLISLSGTSQATLANRAVIAIDQDPAGLQGRLLSTSGTGQVWVKPLSDGSIAVALLNRGAKTVRLSTTAGAIGLEPAGSYTATELWSSSFSRIGAAGAIAANVAGYSTTLLRVRAG